MSLLVAPFPIHLPKKSFVANLIDTTFLPDFPTSGMEAKGDLASQGTTWSYTFAFPPLPILLF